MMTPKPVTTFLFALMLLCISSFVASAQMSLTAEQIAAIGKFDGQLYVNREAGFSILLPGGWAVMSDADNRATAEQGRAASRVLASDSANTLPAAVEASIAKTAVLLQANSKPTRPGAGKALMSSGIEILSGSKTPQQYIEDNKRLVLRNATTRLTKDTSLRTFGQAQFATFEVAGDANGKPFKQRYVATVHRGRAIFFVFTLLDDSYDGLIDNSLASFKLLK